MNMRALLRTSSNMKEGVVKRGKHWGPAARVPGSLVGELGSVPGCEPMGQVGRVASPQQPGLLFSALFVRSLGQDLPLRTVCTVPSAEGPGLRWGREVSLPGPWARLGGTNEASREGRALETRGLGGTCPPSHRPAPSVLRRPCRGEAAPARSLEGLLLLLLRARRSDPAGCG